MVFEETNLRGAYIIYPEHIKDERGFFARSFCTIEFGMHGLKTCFVQCNISYNRKKGTLRGMHYQASPYEETKIVSCTSGAIYDVIIDLRQDSRTYLQWISVYLSYKNHKMLYIPDGFAHGFQTLEDNTVIFYQMSEFHHPESSFGIRWDDPVFDIKWPETEDRIISETDRHYELFRKEIKSQDKRKVSI